MHEPTRKKPATRRAFLGSAAATGAGVKAPSAFAPNPDLGRKGKTYPDQRRKYRDARTGRTVWQMTDTPGRITMAQYATQPMTTPDGRWLVYGSDRAGERGQVNLFKMDLRTGISTQLTESNRNLTYRWSHISPDGREVYFIEDKNLLRAVNVESLEERDLCRIENGFRPHQLTVSPDNRHVICPTFLENKSEDDFLVKQGFLIRSALVVVRTADGRTHRLCDGNTPRTHAQYCPADANLILYCCGGPWWYVQRLWLIRADGTGNRPIFLQTHFEGVGHEFWSENGKTIYTFCNGGRQPQGLWAVDADGSNERCVLAGACTGHGTANPQDDRFVTNEIFNDFKTGLWVSRKGAVQPELLCFTGTDPSKFPPYTGASAHPRFLRDGKAVVFSSAMTGSGEVYLVEL